MDNLIANWKKDGKEKSEIVVQAADACLGWPYVFGAAGALCEPGNRRSSYNGNINRHPAEAEQIKKRCQVLSGTRSTCAGCKYYPDAPVRFFDCRGFTRWLLAQVGISLQGAGATSQWNTAANWTQKGEIRDMPRDKVCCVFMQNQSDHKTMEHTGMFVGGDLIIHCSGEVKKGKVSDKGWTHYAIPKGLEGTVPVPDPENPTLRRGSQGEYVTLAQTKLIQRGYDLAPYGADGKFGAKTEEAVKAFQRDNGLTPDGVIGKKSWNALLSGQVDYYRVTISHVSKTVGDEIVSKYGGIMQKESD